MSWESKPGDVVAVKAVMYNVPGLFSSAPPTVRISPGLYWPGMDGQDDNDFAQPVAPEDICAWIPPDHFAALEELGGTLDLIQNRIEKVSLEIVDYFPPGEALSFPNALEMLDRAWERLTRARSIIATVTGTPVKPIPPPTSLPQWTVKLKLR